MGKANKKGGQVAAADAGQIAELRRAVEAGEAPELSDAAFEGLAEFYARADGATALDGLRALHPAAESGARLKALKRAAFRLTQRGIDASGLALEPPTRGIRIGDAEGGLPVLLSPIDVNSVRTITLPLSRGPAVAVVEAVIKSRELFRLKASPTHRDGYRRWANLKSQPIEGALPERVRMPGPWRERKLWEIAGLYNAGLTGAEVDRGIVEALPVPDREPPHPARQLDLGSQAPLSWAELGRRPERVRPLYQGAALAALRPQWYEAGGGPDIEPSAELREAMQRAVADWVTQWGSDRATETLLDGALFFHAVGDLDAARAYREAAAPVEPGPRTARLHAFLLDFALWQLGQS